MTRIVCYLWLSLTLAWHQLWPAVHCLLSHVHESCSSTVQKTISSVDANTVTPWADGNDAAAPAVVYVKQYSTTQSIRGPGG